MQISELYQLKTTFISQSNKTAANHMDYILTKSNLLEKKNTFPTVARDLAA